MLWGTGWGIGKGYLHIPRPLTISEKVLSMGEEVEPPSPNLAPSLTLLANSPLSGNQGEDAQGVVQIFGC